MIKRGAAVAVPQSRHDLLLRGGAHVECAHQCTEAARRCDRLQSRDARAEHERFRGRHGSSRGGEHRQEFAECVGADQRGFVTRDGALRRERVHRLRARYPRHELQRKRRDTTLIEGVERRRRAGGGKKAEQGSAVRKFADFVDARALNLHDERGARGRRCSVRSQLGPRRCVGCVRHRSADAGASLDYYFVTSLDQPPNALRDECDAGFAWHSLFQYGNAHYEPGCGVRIGPLAERSRTAGSAPPPR